MTITDIDIYRLEEIHGEINDLVDEADAIVATSDDYIIVRHADKWIKIMRENVQGETNAITIATTIDDLWNDFYEYNGDTDDQ